ncbi:MAG TPA: response regulator transcription factor [Verrucomicrobiae bacterium]
MAGLTEVKRLTVLLVDDHPIVREGLARLVRRQEHMVVAGEVGSVGMARQWLATNQPELVLIDLLLPDGCGLAFTKELISSYPEVRILVVSQCDELLYAERALKSGAHGFVMKDRDVNELMTAIRQVAAGDFYVSPKINALALRQLVAGKSVLESGGVENLTDRELQVLQMLGVGLKTRQVAERLNLSVKTVETHRENIKHKLNIPDALGLIRFAAHWVEGQGRGNVNNNSISELNQVASVRL